MIESIIRGEHDDGSRANGQGEEALHHRLLPNGGVQELPPLGLQKEDYAFAGTFQSHRPDKKDEQHYVREKGQEIGRLAGTLDPTHDHQKDHHPGDKQGQGQLPTGVTNAVRYVQLLLDHYIPKKDKKTVTNYFYGI